MKIDKWLDSMEWESRGQIGHSFVALGDHPEEYPHYEVFELRRLIALARLARELRPYVQSLGYHDGEPAVMCRACGWWDYFNRPHSDCPVAEYDLIAAEIATGGSEDE